MNASSRSADMWYGLYAWQRRFADDYNLDNIAISSMMWGSQYDAMMNWMPLSDIIATAIKSGDKKNTNTNRTTGTFVKDKINNVFDLRGNSSEFDFESEKSSWNFYRATRGSDYNTTGGGSPSSRFGSSFRANSDSIGSRLTLNFQ